MPVLKAPFPWYGGKSRVASVVWRAFGDVQHYVEPFFGSGAVLLGRPGEPKIETVNDVDGWIVNFWRAVKNDPEAVAAAADQPVFELDLHARHRWLLARAETLAEELRADPEAFDARAAGWWCWGLSCWIGSGWCSVESKRIPYLSGAGQGVNRKRTRLWSRGVGVVASGFDCADDFRALSSRLRGVRVCSGDWTRIVSPSALGPHSSIGVFLDPPYQTGGEIYGREVGSIPRDVEQWALAATTENDRLRVAVCGYEGDVDLPGWYSFAWSSGGAGEHRRHRERIYFSPSCLPTSLEHAAFLGRPMLDFEVS